MLKSVICVSKKIGHFPFFLFFFGKGPLNSSVEGYKEPVIIQCRDSNLVTVHSPHSGGTDGMRLVFNGNLDSFHCRKGLTVTPKTIVISPNSFVN